MKLTFVVIIGCSTLLGCRSAFSTKQTDISYYENGKPQRAITTQAKASTLNDSKSALANFKASQTDKTQGATVGSLNQESSGTNAVKMLEALKGIAEALPK